MAFEGSHCTLCSTSFVAMFELLDSSTVLHSLAVTLLFYLTIGAIRRVYLSPLSKFPGPKLAALTLWNEFYWDVVKRGLFMWRIQEMHEKYGSREIFAPCSVCKNTNADPRVQAPLSGSTRTSCTSSTRISTKSSTHPTRSWTSTGGGQI